MGVQQDEYRAHKRRNALQTCLLVAALTVIAAVIGWSIGGTLGLVLLAGGAIFFLVVGRQAGPRIVLRMYRARPLTPSEAPDLVEMVRDLSERANLPTVPQLNYIPTRVVNAFATGTKSQAYIGVTDGILNVLTERELRGVLAHEITHLVNNDLTVMGLADMVSRVTFTVSRIGQLLLFINLPWVLMGGGGMPWLFIIVMIAAPMIVSLLQLALSRTREFDADLGAARLTGDPRGLASALQKIERIQGGVFERIFMPGRRVPDPSLLRTHPPVEERVRRLYALEGLDYEPPGGDRQLPELAGFPRAPLERPRWHFLSGVWC